MLILAAFTFLLYANTLNSPFALDDYHNILANKPIRISAVTFSSLRETVQKSLIKNRPVANISLALNYFFHQYEVNGYHLVNIVIHAANGILLFFFVQYTLLLAPGHTPGKNARFIAFAAALLWLIHPLQTQSVTYIIQRMNSMAAMFYLLSFVLYIKSRTNPKSLGKFLFACASLGAGLLAIGAKENALMLPVFLLLYEWYFFNDLRINLKIQHYLAIALLLLFLLGAVFYYLGPHPADVLAGYAGRNFTLGERLLTQLRVVVFYISLVFFPLPSRLTLEHDFLLSQSLMSPVSTLFSLLMLLAIILAAVFSARRERILSFCLLWFLGNLLIESSFIPLEIIFEHRTYLPSMLLVFLVVMVVQRSVVRSLPKLLLLVIAVLLLSSWTYARNSTWENELSLWTDIARKAPNKPRAQMNLGIILSREGRMDEAMQYLERAVALDPDNDLVHYSLGDALMKQKRYVAASESYARALQIKPDNTLARFNLGKSLAAAGKHQNAVYHYRLVADRDPFIGYQVYYYMGNSLYQLGRYAEAVEAYRMALQEKPDYREALQAFNNTRKIMEILQSRKPADSP